MKKVIALSQRRANIINFLKSFFSPDETEIDILTLKGFIQDLWMRIKRVEVTALGAQLAFFFLLSFFPLLLFSIQLLPYLNLHQDTVFDFLYRIMPQEVYILIEGTLAEVLNNRNSGLLSIGVLGTIWSSSKGMDALLSALNKAYDTKARASILDRVLSLLFTSSLVVVVLIALVLPVFGHQISVFMMTSLGMEYSFVSFWRDLRWFRSAGLFAYNGH